MNWREAHTALLKKLLDHHNGDERAAFTAAHARTICGTCGQGRNEPCIAREKKVPPHSARIRAYLALVDVGRKDSSP